MQAKKEISSNTNESFLLGSRPVGEGELCFIIAEIGQAHDGSLGTAHAYIDAVAETGADAIKFQTHIASEESTLDEPFRVKFSKQDETRYDYWKRMEFTKNQWGDLSKHAQERGLIFLSSPFSVKAVEMLSDIGMQAWKIGSGEVNSDEVLEAMSRNGAPILLSTGMSRFEEIELAVKRIKNRSLPFAIFQCTSKYPTRLEEVGLNIIKELRNRFDCPVGLSDHSGTIFPGLAAMALGVNLLEIHVTFDKGLFGPDVKASVTLDDLSLLVRASKAFDTMLKNPVDKKAMAEELAEMRSLFSKSIAPKSSLAKGTILRKDLLSFKKPGTGIPPSEMDSLIGRRLRRDVPVERLIRWEDLEQENE